MIQIVGQFWKPFLFTDGFGMTGVAMTLWLLVASLAIGFCLALPLAIVRNARNPFFRGPVWVFTYVFRGTPLYVQLIVVYSGVYSLGFVHQVPALNAFFRSAIDCTILAFGLNTAAYTTEIFAGAIKATAAGDVDAARSLGMSRATMYRRIVLPAALRRALPAYSNEVILMLHSTTLAFTATVPDILKIANDANAATYDPFDSFGLAALLYLGISFTLVAGFRRVERRVLAYAKM